MSNFNEGELVWLITEPDKTTFSFTTSPSNNAFFVKITNISVFDWFEKDMLILDIGDLNTWSKEKIYDLWAKQGVEFYLYQNKLTKIAGLFIRNIATTLYDDMGEAIFLMMSIILFEETYWIVPNKFVNNIQRTKP
jgi:hypothetical protein